MNSSKFEEVLTFEGQENVTDALTGGKGVIMLAMHVGSCEISSLSCALLGNPYKVVVKPQSKYLELDDLLNTYRSCGGSVVISRGLGTRDIIKSFPNLSSMYNNTQRFPSFYKFYFFSQYFT